MKDIDRVIESLRSTLPGVQVEQLKVKYPSDDDGLWFVKHPDSDVEVNIESHTGEIPFLIENSGNSDRITAKTLEETVAAVSTALGMLSVNGPDMKSISMEAGNLRAWVEQETIHIIAQDRPSNDPVELNAAEARQLANALLKMAGQLHN